MTSPRSLSFVAALLVAALLVAAPGVATAAPPSEVRLRRYVLLVGVDDGGPTRARLRYATSDARNMGRVLQSLGGVAASDVVFVSDGSRAAIDAAFAEVERRLRAGVTPGVRRELLVYYSGHSDEDGLMIGKDRLSYDELRTRVQRASADLRVVILDSCASGAFTRRKGGTRRPPFLLDTSIDMRGHAFLTSSAADERAQESDRIAASYFTYYLVSGLRGAADANQDRRVTLQEAYQFASQETLARTERSQAGPQHAAYEFDLAGTGDMVVTDVRGTQSGLVLTPELGGRITVREANGALVAELRKPPGNTIELGLDPGAYVVSMERSSATLQANVALVAGSHTPLAAAAFQPGPPRELAMARGDAPAGEAGEPAATATAAASAPAAAAPAAAAPSPFKAIVFPRDADAQADVRGVAFGLIAERSRRVVGLQYGVGWAQIDQELRGMQLSAAATLAQGRVRGFQLSGGAHILRGDGRGFQLTGGANVVEGSYFGFQLAGGANVATISARGFQLAGGANLAHDMRGFQFATVNIAEEMSGAQLGVVNTAVNTTGVRLGVINVAKRSKGFQLGVINVAEHDDGESFALLNFIGNGIHDATVFATDVMFTNLGIKLGGRHLYTHLSVGYQPGDALAADGAEVFTRGTRRWGAGGGFGWRFPIERGPLAYLELEAGTTQLRSSWSWDATLPNVNSLRAQVGLRLARYLVAVAGAGVNVAVGTDSTDASLGWGPEFVGREGATTVRIYPGLMLGLQI
jgi:hypothetical protein